MKRSKLWLMWTLIASALLLSVEERNRRRRRSTSVAQTSRLIDDHPRNRDETHTNQTADQSPVPSIGEPAATKQHYARADEHEAARHLRIGAIAIRRRSIRRKRAVTFWVQLLAG